MKSDTCDHKARYTIKELFQMQRAFRCRNCDRYLEPDTPWRQIRTVVNITLIILALVAVFQPLEGTAQAFLRMLLLLAAVAALFLILNILILNLAPMVPVRPEHNPELLALRREQTERLMDIESENEEQGPALQVRRVGDKATRTLEEEHERIDSDLARATAEARDLQAKASKEPRL